MRNTPSNSSLSLATQYSTTQPNFIYLDNQAPEANLPENRTTLFNYYRTIEELKKIPVPEYIVTDSNFGGGRTVTEGQFGVGVYACGDKGIEYYLCFQPGRIRFEAGPWRLVAGQKADILDVFPMPGGANPSITEFGGNAKHSDQASKDALAIAKITNQLVYISPTQIGFMEYNKNTYLIQPGYYWIHNKNIIKVVNVKSLNEGNIIAEGDCTIVRIPNGHFMCYVDTDGSIQKTDASSKEGNHTRYVLRFGQKFLGIHPTSLRTLIYGDNSQFQRVFLQSSDIVFYRDANGVTKKIQDVSGEVILHAPDKFETHTVDNKRSIKIHQKNERYLAFGTTAILNLNAGEYAVHYDENRSATLIQGPKSFEADLSKGERFETDQANNIDVFSIVNQSNAVWIKTLGPFQIVNVPLGYAAITSDARKTGKERFSVLEGGTYYVLDDPQWRLQGEIQLVNEQRISLGGLKNTHGQVHCVARTKDRIELDIRAYILYKISDPIKAFTGVADIQTELRTKAESVLLAIIGRHASEEVTQGVNSHIAKSEPSLHLSLESFSTQLMRELDQGMREFSRDRGVELTSMNVEELDFADPSLKKAMEQQSETSQRMKVQLHAMEDQRLLQAQEAELAAQTQTIKANADASKVVIEAETEAKKRQIAVDLENSVRASQAETEAKAIEVVAMAQAKALALKYAAMGEAIAKFPVLLPIITLQVQLEGQTQIAAASKVVMPNGVVQGAMLWDQYQKMIPLTSNASTTEVALNPQ